MVKQERAVRTRLALIRAGAEAFAAEGYVSASLTTISRRAGVSTGALHFHFENKLALARAVEDEAARTVGRIAREAADRHGGALEALMTATHALMSRIADDTVVRAGFVLCDDLAAEEGVSARQEWQRWIEETVQRAERDGRLARGVSAKAAAATVVALTVGLEVLGRADPEWLATERIAAVWDFCCGTAKQTLRAD
ncbi:ScbR family autoregulator-binding transcription factor [Streptomyces sp. NPDC052101]|uniref:ScbR family autoregulator-binding transcription factor n=1 Tax=Streptomyces sp. NPDC052101 TaxID=3155763 RepID=UPI00342640EA